MIILIFFGNMSTANFWNLVVYWDFYFQGKNMTTYKISFKILSYKFIFL